MPRTDAANRIIAAKAKPKPRPQKYRYVVEVMVETDKKIVKSDVALWVERRLELAGPTIIDNNGNGRAVKTCVRVKRDADIERPRR